MVFPESFTSMLDHLTLLMLPVLLLVLGALAAKEGWVKSVYKKIYSRWRMRQLLQRSWQKPPAGALIFGLDWLNRFVYSPVSADAHSAVFAPTGGGKTSSVLIPSLRTMQSACGYIPDISGDIFTNVPHLDFVLYEPTNRTSKAKYNVFGIIDKLSSESEKNVGLQKLVEIFFPDRKQTDDAGRYFFTGGKDIVLASMLAFYSQGMDFPEICQKIQQTDYNSLFNDIVKTGHKKAIGLIQQFRGQSDKNIAGCFGEAVKSITLFADEDLMGGKLGRGYDSISADVVNEKFFVLNIPREDRGTYVALNQLITAQVMQVVNRRQIRQEPFCFLCLDEVSSLLQGSASIENQLVSSLQNIRKLNGRIVFLTQSIKDLDAYLSKREIRGISIDNVRFVVAMGAFDPESRTYFADLIGKKPVKVGMETKYEYRVPPDDFADLPDHQLYLIWRGGHMKLRKAFFFKERRLQ